MMYLLVSASDSPDLIDGELLTVNELHKAIEKRIKKGFRCDIPIDRNSIVYNLRKDPSFFSRFFYNKDLELIPVEISQRKIYYVFGTRWLHSDYDYRRDESGQVSIVEVGSHE